MDPTIAFWRVPQGLLKKYGRNKRHQNGNEHHNRRVDTGKFVNKFFLLGFCGLRFGNQANDALHGGICHQSGHFNFKQTTAIDRSRKHFIANIFRNPGTFASNRGLIEFTLPIHDNAIHW